MVSLPTTMSRLKQLLPGLGQLVVEVFDPSEVASCSPDVYVFTKFWLVVLPDDVLCKLQQQRAGEQEVNEPRNLPHRDAAERQGKCLGIVRAGGKILINPTNLPADDTQVAFFIVNPVTGELVPAEVQNTQPGILSVVLPDALRDAIMEAWTPETP